MKKYLSLLFVISLFCGCQYTGEEKYVSLDDVKYITDFPYNEDLKEIHIDFDEIGIQDVKIVGDSLVILAHRGYWSIQSADLKNNYGHCLSIGQGPDEFLYIPYVGTALFQNKQDSLWAYIPDEYNRKITAFNVTEFIKSGKQILRPTIITDLLSSPKWAIVPYSDKEFMLLDPFDGIHGLKRNITMGDTIVELPGTQSLSMHTIEEGGSEINIISAIVRYAPSVDKFVEAMIYMNQINVYSRDGSSGTTICVGDKLDNLAKIEDTTPRFRPWTYNGLFVNELGYGVIYSGHTLNPIESRETEIQFFNWDNEPVYRIKQSFEAFGMDMDLTHKRLWVIDKDEDELRCYDATPIINAYLNK